MESLNNYITERIRVDNIKHPEFPINGNTEEIVDFLKERGFEEIKDLPHLPMYTDYVTVFNNTYKNKCFGVMVDSLSKRNIICFADTSRKKISESNMLYMIKDGSAYAQYRKIWDIGDAYELLDEDEFEKEMKSYFG